MAPAPNTIHHGDCLAGLRSVESGSAVLAIVDGPYGMGKFEGDVFDPHFYSVMFAEVHRSLCDGGQIYVYAPQGNGELFELQRLLTRRFNWRRQIIWHYRNGHYRGSAWGWCYESILWASKGEKLARWNIDHVRVPYAVRRDAKHIARDKRLSKSWCENARGAKPSDVWMFSRLSGWASEVQCKGPPVHPTQKPEALAERMILASSDPGDLVIVPFAGSGSECAVAQRLGRRWISWEINEEYLAIARERVQAARTGVPTAEARNGQLSLLPT